MSGERDALAELLTEHEWRLPTYGSRQVLACRCGDELIPASSNGVATYADHRAHVADVLAERDRRIKAEALREAADDVGGSTSPNFGMRHDGTVDPQAAAYVEGLHDAWALLRDRADRIEAP